MKLVRVGPDAVFHRFLTPRWASEPLSGAGAAARGGRFNPPGREALYLSQAPMTALEEFRQGASIAPPATLAAYRVTLGEVADLTAGYEPADWPPDWADWNCAWKQIARVSGGRPPSWDLGESLVDQGRAGLLFPSLRHPGGINLVVFPEILGTGDHLSVHDPAGDLPRDQRSWR
jgi:RES domain-containing protein